MDLNSAVLEEALNLLGSLLAARNSEPIHIVVSGGAALIATGIVTRGTHDLDILATREIIDGDISRAWPLPQYFKDAATEVAESLELEPNWANATTSLLMIDLNALPREIWTDLETREYGGCLTVSYVSRIGQIFLKVWAAMGRDEERDITDLKKLKPTQVEAQAVMDWLVREELISPFSTETATAVMKAIGHNDVIPIFT